MALHEARAQIPDIPSDGPPRSRIWQAALDKYYQELGDKGLKGSIADEHLNDAKSPSDLLQRTRSLTFTHCRAEWWARALKRHAPVLAAIIDITAVISLALGISVRVTAIVWGSISLILRSPPPVLPDVLDMVDELRHTLPRFHKYEQEMPRSAALAGSLLAVYFEFILFCLDANASFGKNSDYSVGKAAWLSPDHGITRLITDLRHYSRQADAVADVILFSSETNHTEVLRNPKAWDLPCNTIPCAPNPRFFDRSTEIQTMRTHLDPQSGKENLRAMAVYGLAGTGKTQLALQYAHTSSEAFDFVIWVQAETQTKLTQSLMRLSANLGLINAAGDKNDSGLMQNIRSWLNNTNNTFLLVFDNTERDDILDQMWPVNRKGSVIITTRSSAIATRWSTNIIRLECFKEDAATELLYSLANTRPSGESDTQAAKELGHILGGLPLAIVQVSDFIRDQGLSYEEFLRRYKKSPEKILERLGVSAGGTNTLNTLWDASFQSLSMASSALLNLLAFFNTDLVPEMLLTNTKAGLTDPRLQFLFDEFEFSDSVTELAQMSLLTRLPELKTLSIHPLVQLWAFLRLSLPDRIFYLDNAVLLQYHGFPNTWNQEGPHQDHGWKSWERCGKVMPHFSRLMEISVEHKLTPSNVERFAELIFRAGTYLWENEQPTTARTLFEFGLSLDINCSTLICAQAYRVLGHIAVDISQPRSGLSEYERALSIREIHEKPNSLPIADIYDSIACSYTEIGDVSRAFDYLSKADAIHYALGARDVARTQAIYAITYHRAGKHDEALIALKDCWQLQGITEEQVLQSGYPKHSGDIVLLARILYAQGQKDRAQKLIGQTISMRKSLFGDKSPRVADSMFTLARMLTAENENHAAIKLLREIVDISRGMLEMEGHLARALWFWSAVEAKMSDDVEMAEKLKHAAKKKRAKISELEFPIQDTDDSFMNLVPWMLW